MEVSSNQAFHKRDSSISLPLFNHFSFQIPDFSRNLHSRFLSKYLCHFDHPSFQKSSLFNDFTFKIPLTLQYFQILDSSLYPCQPRLHFRGINWHAFFRDFRVQGRVVQSWVKITQGFFARFEFRFKSLKKHFSCNSFCLQVDDWKL